MIQRRRTRVEITLRVLKMTLLRCSSKDLASGQLKQSPEMCFPMECVHSFPVFSDALPEQMISAVAVMDNLSQIAVGLANGAVMVLMPGMAHSGVDTGSEIRRRILLPANPRGYRVTNPDTPMNTDRRRRRRRRISPWCRACLCVWKSAFSLTRTSRWVPFAEGLLLTGAVHRYIKIKHVQNELSSPQKCHIVCDDWCGAKPPGCHQWEF